jgi:hypothetical protein
MTKPSLPTLPTFPTYLTYLTNLTYLTYLTYLTTLQICLKHRALCCAKQPYRLESSYPPFPISW